MPVGEPVSDDMLQKFKNFLYDSYEDFVISKSRATLRGLIISLYETAKVACTLDKDINRGPANYKYVKQSLPVTDNVLMLEKVRNDLVHNYHRVDSIVKSVRDAIGAFGMDNMNCLARMCGLPSSLYTDIINFCVAHTQRTVYNVPIQGNTSGFMSDIINGISPNRR